MTRVDQGFIALEGGETNVDGGQLCRIGREESPQRDDVRQFARIECFGEPLCQFPLAAPIVGQGQELDGDLAGLLVGKSVEQGLEGPSVFLPRKQLSMPL